MEEILNRIFQITLPWISLIVGAIITNHFFLRRGRSNLTFDLHKEFNSNEFSKIRRLADELSEKNPTTGYRNISKIEDEKSIALFTLMRFYQRLWVAIKFKKVQRKMIPRLFGEIFIYWYYMSFKNNLIDKTDWEIRNDIQELYEWMKKQLPKAKYEKYKLRSQKKLQHRISAIENNLDLNGHLPKATNIKRKIDEQRSK